MDKRWVDVSHEALIRNWPRLRRWIEEDRAGLRLHRRITEAAQEWQQREFDDSVLFRGTRLAQSIEWREGNDDSLNVDERRFLDASLALQQREAQELRDRARRELESAQQLAAAEAQRAEAAQALVQTERAARKRQRRFVIGLGVLTMVAIAVAWFADTERRRADVQQRLAIARQLEVAARSTMDNSGAGLVRAVLLAIESLRSAWTAEAQARLEEGLALLPQPADRSWKAHSAAVLSIAFSRDGRWLATQGMDGKVVVWDAAAAMGRPNPQPIVKLDAPVDSRSALAFSPDGRWLVAGCRRAACVWETSNWQQRKPLDNGAMVWGIAFSADGTRMATTSYGSKDAKLYDVTRDWAVLPLREAVDLPTSSARGVSFTPDGSWLLTSGGNSIVQRLIANPGTAPQRSAQQGGEASRLAFSADAQRLATADDGGGFSLLDARVAQDGHIDLKEVTRIGNMPGAEIALSVGFSADGHHLATSAWVWDVHLTPKERARSVDRATAVAFHPSAAWLATGLRDGSLNLRSRFDGGIDTARLAHGAAVNGVTFSADGRWLATASDDGMARVFDAQNWAELARLDHGAAVTNVGFTADRRWLATASENQVRVFEPAAAWAERLRAELADTVDAMGFSADGRWFVTASQVAHGESKRSVRIFDTTRWTAAQATVDVDDLVANVAFSPDGKSFAIRTQRRCTRGLPDKPGSTTVWALDGGHPLGSMLDLTETRLQFPCRGADEAAVVSNGDTALVKQAVAWPAVVLGQHVGHADSATNPDGRWVARAQGDWDDHTVRIYPTRALDLIELACQRLPRGLDAEEWKRFMPHEPRLRATCSQAPQGQR